MRCLHESKLHEESCFITCTYSEENNPVSLCPSHFTKFMKRLRKKYENKKIRYFQCGEYGEQNCRPHHHACIYGLTFTDRILYREKPIKLYISETLNSIWSYGYCTIGEVTFESAAYVARYITKKITGPDAAKYYGTNIPEYITMSRRPGIAAVWWELYKDDIRRIDGVIINGKKVMPGKYYDKKFDNIEHKLMLEIKNKRIQKINKSEQTPERRITKEKVAWYKLKQLPQRSLRENIC